MFSSYVRHNVLECDFVMAAGDTACFVAVAVFDLVLCTDGLVLVVIVARTYVLHTCTHLVVYVMVG